MEILYLWRKTIWELPHVRVYVRKKITIEVNRLSSSKIIPLLFVQKNKNFKHLFLCSMHISDKSLQLTMVDQQKINWYKVYILI